MGDIPGNRIDDNPEIINNEVNVETVGDDDFPIPENLTCEEAKQAFFAFVENNMPNRRSPSPDIRTSDFKTVGTQCGSAETVDEENIVVTKRCFSPQPVETLEVSVIQAEEDEEFSELIDLVI